MFRGLMKVMVLTFLILLGSVLFGTASFASESAPADIDRGILNEIEKTNAFVYEAINETNEAAVKEVLDNSHKIQNELKKMDKLMDMTDESKRQAEEAKILAKIDKLEQDLNKSVEKLCEKLIERTDKRVAELIRKAEKKQIDIVQEYIEVKIQNTDITILVDPCHAH